MRRFLLALAVCSMLGGRARANAPEDVFGISSRINAMGGSGTALANDGFAAYYNPAGLTRCVDSQVSLDIRHTSHSLDARAVGADAPPGSPQIRDVTRLNVGACARLPYHFAVGMTFGIGLENPGTLRLDTASARPNFPLYGQTLEYLNVNLALAWRPVRQLAIGAGASILVNSDLGINAFVPVGQVDEFGSLRNLSFDIGWRMKPRAAPYVGLLVTPHERIRIGLTYRGELAHHLSMPMSIVAIFLDWRVPIPMQLTADTWYSPRSVALGVAGEPIRDLTLSADLTWYDYGALAKSSYPYLRVTPLTSDGSILTLVGLPTPDAPNYRGVWAARFGAEGRLLDDRLALRAGYGVRTSALPSPGLRNTTLLDGTVHSFTLGAGYAFGRSWEDDADRSDPDGDGIRYEGSDEIGINARIDAFARLSIMPRQTDDQKDLRYGGHLFDVGATFTLGWR